MTLHFLLQRNDIPEDVKREIEQAIDEQRKTKEILLKMKKSEEYYRSLFENIPIGLYRSTPDHKFLAANPTFVKQVGFTSFEELLKIGTKKLAAKRHYQRERFLKEINEKGEVKGLEFQLKRPDGTSSYIRENARAVKNSEGSILFYEGSVEDITDRVQAEEALRESEKKYRTLIDNLSEIVIELNSEGKFSFISPQSLDILGYSPEEVIGRSSFDFIHPEDMEKALVLFQRVLTGEQIYNFEYRAKHKEGHNVPLSVSGKLIEENNEYKLVSVLSDITERKNTEKSLIKTKARLEYLLKSSPAVIYTCYPCGNFPTTFMSENVQEITGYKVHEFVNNPSFWINGIHPDDRQQVVGNFKEIVNKEYYSEIYRFKHKNGSYHWMLDEAILIRDRDGNPIETVGYWTDINERKRAEEALQESEERLRSFMDSATDSFMLLDSELNIIEVNKNLTESWNLNKNEILGKNISELTDRVRFDSNFEYGKQLSQLNEVLQTGKKYDEEFNVVHPEYGEGYISVKAFKVGSGLGIISRDITSQKQAEFIRKELEQRRENFIYMASHELRTPLTVISGYCDFLEKNDRFIDHERRDKIISIMKNNINRLERLTEDVTQVAQIEKDQFQVFKQEFDLCEFLNSNLDQYNQLLGNQFKFQSCFTEKPIMINADPNRLQQVLENVVSNAIKHTSKNKREITVKVEQHDSNVRISISDNGAGITPDHIEAIFEQFISFQTEYAAGGTGIGLYLSRKILEAHGGTIIAHSKGSGHGTTFIIELPWK